MHLSLPRRMSSLHRTRTAGAMGAAFMAASLATVTAHPEAAAAAVRTDRPALGDHAVAEPEAVPGWSRPPGPDFVRYCLRHGNRYVGTVALCNRAARYNINRARRREGLGGLAVGPRLATRSTDTQIVLVTDAERTSRHLPALRETAGLDRLAIDAASAETDPTGPPDATWVANWAGDYRTPLAADYAWMYDDGVGGTNAGCVTASSPDCWAHRRNILAPFGGRMGAAALEVAGSWSATELMVQG